MDEDEYFPERDYRLHLEDDGDDDDDDVIFNIPEIFQGDEDDVWGSEDDVLGPDSGHLEIEDMDLDLSADNHDISDEAHRPSHDHIPDVIIQLQKQLLGDYVLPPCPAEPPHQHTLSISETLSLKHYLAWSDTHGTVKAYNAHAQILAEATQEEILSLYKVKQLAMDLTGIRPTFVDMCPNSCMAFTGDAKSQ